MSESYLETPYTASAIERDLITALDERDAVIDRQRRRLIELESQRAGPPFLALVLFVLPWWGLLCVSVADGWLPLFGLLNLVLLAGMVLWVRWLR